MPRHVYNAAAKFASEYPNAGTRNQSVGAFPNTIQDLEYDTELEFNEAFGPGYQALQSQELTAFRYPLRVDFQLYSGAFLRDYCLIGGGGWPAGILPSVSWEFTSEYDLSKGDAIWGAVCSSLRLSAAQKGIVSVSTDWLGQHYLPTTGFSWDVPAYRPYVWAKGTWYDARQGIDIYPIGIDITVENNVQEIYAMLTSLALDDTDWDPSHLLAGFQNVRADIRALAKHEIEATDDIDVTLTFISGPNTLTIALTDGAYRGQQRRIPQDDLVEYGIPIVFKGISISES